MSVENYQDRTLTCRDCGRDFTLRFSRYMVIFGCYIMHCAFDLEAVVDGGELWFL